MRLLGCTKIFISKRLGANQVSIRLKVDQKEHSKTSLSRLEKWSSHKEDLNQSVTKSIPGMKQESIRLEDSSPKTIHNLLVVDENDETMIENKVNRIIKSSMDSLKGMLEESLEKIYQRLNESNEDTISHRRQTEVQLGKIEEKCNETETMVKQNVREMKESIRLQHRKQE